MSQLLIEPEVHADELLPRPRSREAAPKLAHRVRLKKKTRVQLVTKHVMLWIRRGHLYFGLFLFPWALLYGVTAFLFNHPMAFSDQKLITFVRGDYAKDAADPMATPKQLADDLIGKLNAAQKPAIAYQLGEGEIRFNREFAFATFKSDTKNFNLLLDLNNGSGTIREQPAPRTNVGGERLERAPFAIGEAGPPAGGRGAGVTRQGGERRGAGLNSRPAGLETALKSQVELAIPQICQSAGIACKEVVITSIPELSFPVKVGPEQWTAIYHPLNGSVSGRKATDAAPSNELTFRRFLLRLHTAHGYPSGGGVRWAWALIVDVMAAIMCFWGVSGMLMWWQIKSTRMVGAATVLLGVLAATGLGVGMHFAMR